MGRLENDCLVLLCYIADNPNEQQSYRLLETATGIPRTRIRELIYYPWICATPETYYYWALEKNAEKYGFDIAVVHGERGRHLLVAKRPQR